MDRALPANAGYLSVAALPDDKAETLALFTRHAYAFIKQTRVEWRYDEAASQVETTFKATPGDGGRRQRPAAGPVPAPVVQERVGRRQARPGLRHRARQAAPAGRAAVQDHHRYNGFVPYWPGITESPRLDELKT
jgi:hypothetical protein